MSYLRRRSKHVGNRKYGHKMLDSSRQNGFSWLSTCLKPAALAVLTAASISLIIVYFREDPKDDSSLDLSLDAAGGLEVLAIYPHDSRAFT